MVSSGGRYAQVPAEVARAPSRLRAGDTSGQRSDDSNLAEIVRRLVAALHPQRVYLFGSRARGDHREDSDYDVLLIIDTERERLHELTVTGYGALRGVGASVDVLVMTPYYFERRASVVATLPAAVLREGQLLYAA